MKIALKNGSIKPSKCNPYFVGFPTYAISNHMSKLVNSGYIVIIYNQINDINNKGKKDHKIHDVYTSSNFINTSINEFDPQCIAVIKVREYNCVITKSIRLMILLSLITPQTGDVNLMEIYDDVNNKDYIFNEFYRIITSYNIKELIYYGEYNKTFLDNEFVKNKISSIQKTNKLYEDINYQEKFLEKVYNYKSTKNSYKLFFQGILHYLGLTTNPDLIPPLSQQHQG